MWTVSTRLPCPLFSNWVQPMGGMEADWGVGGKGGRRLIPLVPSLQDYTFLQWLCSSKSHGIPSPKATDFVGFWTPSQCPSGIRVAVALQWYYVCFPISVVFPQHCPHYRSKWFLQVSCLSHSVPCFSRPWLLHKKLNSQNRTHIAKVYKLLPKILKMLSPAMSCHTAMTLHFYPLNCLVLRQMVVPGACELLPGCSVQSINCCILFGKLCQYVWQILWNSFTLWPRNFISRNPSWG